MSEWTEYDELAKMGDELKALLADREALVRYVMTLEEHWGEATFPVGYTRKVGKLRKALSQELRDEINAI